MALVVGDQSVHLEPRIALQELLGARAQHRLADIERMVSGFEPERLGSVEEQPRFASGSAAELDEVGRTRDVENLSCRALEQLLFRAGQVVFGELANAVKQARPLLVVEMLRRNRLAPPAEPSP